MSYPKKYRERTIEYRQAGHTLEETHQIFKVSRSTIQEWEKQQKETGDLEPIPKLPMNGNEFAPDDGGTSELNEGEIIGRFLLKTDK